MRTSELVLIVFTIVFSAFLGYQSLEFNYFSNQGFGPGFVPLNFSLATLALGVLIFLKFGKRRAQVDGDTFQVKEHLKAAIPPIFAVLLLIVAIYLMHFGSVIAPLFVVMMVISKTLLGHSLIRAFVMNLITLGAIFAIFNLWLGIPVT